MNVEGFAIERAREIERDRTVQVGQLLIECARGTLNSSFLCFCLASIHFSPLSNKSIICLYESVSVYTACMLGWKRLYVERPHT
jgi:hypothetical protein